MTPRERARSAGLTVNSVGIAWILVEALKADSALAVIAVGTVFLVTTIATPIAAEMLYDWWRGKK